MPDSVALDANVLFAGAKRDFLLTLAKAQQYTPTWSTGTLGEVRHNYRKGLIKGGSSPTDATRRADHLVNTLRRQFPHAEVTGYEHRVGSYGLPDRKDEHVLAAADQGRREDDRHRQRETLPGRQAAAWHGDRHRARVRAKACGSEPATGASRRRAESRTVRAGRAEDDRCRRAQ